MIRKKAVAEPPHRGEERHSRAGDVPCILAGAQRARYLRHIYRKQTGAIVSRLRVIWAAMGDGLGLRRPIHALPALLWRAPLGTLPREGRGFVYAQMRFLCGAVLFGLQRWRVTCGDGREVGFSGEGHISSWLVSQTLRFAGSHSTKTNPTHQTSS